MGFFGGNKKTEAVFPRVSSGGELAAALSEAKESLLPLWISAFLASYPLSSTGFIRTNSDPFANPVGNVTRESLDVLYDACAGEDCEPDAVKAALFKLIQLRAVQDFTPSQVIGALCRLKSLVREKIIEPSLAGPETDAVAVVGDFCEMEARVDSLLLLGLDMYAERREKVFRIRVDEIKRSQSQVLRWAKLRRDDDVKASVEAFEESVRNCNSEG
ncbi:MAG: RsbRD N-terminal domain-containing protein [Mailhella sp.]|nr:RsbRD N-terminal domain-containing protein [Mailhella sp.]